MMGLQLEGKTALVTGAGRGIGRACALSLAEAGAEVVAVSRTAVDLNRLVEEIHDCSGIAQARVCDVTDQQQVSAVFDSLERVDILVNNAGLSSREPILDVSDSLDKLLDLNVRATFLVSQSAVRGMVSTGNGGVILNMTSQLGHVGFPGQTVYTMTKHAIEGLTKAMALELAPHNIRVNAIAPTFIETAMTRPSLAVPEFREDMLRRIPLGRVGSAEDVAAAVVFLASSAAAMITGTSLCVDGGWTAQ